MKQQLSAANGRLGISRRLLQELSPYVLLCNRLAFHKFLQLLEILIGIESDADAFAAIAARASRLLVIPLQTLGNVVMDDETHIGLVYPHAKGNSGHDDVYFFHQEIILGFGTSGRIHTGMVSLGLNVVRTKHLGQFFHLFPAQTINDATLARSLLDKFNDFLINVPRFRTHLVVQVGTIERALKLYSILNPQTFLNVYPHLVRRCSGQRNDRSIPYLIYNRSDFPVLGAEVVPPLRDTMRLVHSIK